MSIHKSQGQTLERVKVDLGRVFEKGEFTIKCSHPHSTYQSLGQAYVALSRATSLDGLQVLNFDAKKVSNICIPVTPYSHAPLGTSPSQGCRVE